MLDFLRGQKESILKLCSSLSLDVELYHKAPVEIDVTCFGLDASGRLSDERYFVFYNQTQTPDGAVSLKDGAATGATLFHLDLTKLPAQIDKLSFTAAIEGTRTMKELTKGYARILDGSREVGKFSYDGSQFQAERAIVVCEVYRKGGDWRFNAVGRGFNGGLKALVESFGGTVAPSATPTSPASARRDPAPSAVPPPAGRSPVITPPSGRHSRTAGSAPVRDIVKSLPVEVCTRMENLARQCRGDTEYLSSLYKNMFASLAIYPKVAGRPIKTVLCCDASGSMFDMYRNGRVQRALDKFFAFATTLEDGCSMDLWAFGAKSRQFGAVTMDNVRDYTFSESGGFERWMGLLNYQYNNEPEAMRDIMMIYGALRVPTVVLFLTDGRLSSDWEIEEILIKTSRFPVYWQFIGLHGEEYGVLDHLENVDGRHTQNAGFLKMDDIDDLTDNALYEELLMGVDTWLQELSYKKML